MDEIHERSVEADLLTVLVRLVMQKQLKDDAARGIEFPCNSVPRLMLMSATFSAKLFADYFAPVFVGPSGQSRYSNIATVPEVDIEVFTYPTSIHWVDDVLDIPILLNNAEAIASIYPIPISPSALIHAAGRGTLSEQLATFTSWLLAALSICHAKDPNANCILVFLPGIVEIERVATTIQDRYLELYEAAAARSDFAEDLQPYLLVEVQVLHSLVDDQLKVFAHQQPGRTYVILATNIAESSVTLPNCRYVIDFGTHKEMSYNDRYQCDQLQRVKISQASAKQRSGRTGRVCPGTVIRMYTKKVHDTEMEPYDKPAILRVSLASTILSLKTRARTEEKPLDQGARSSKQQIADDVNAAFIQQCELDDAQRVLSQCIQAPSLETLDTAYTELLYARAVELTDLNSVRQSVADERSSSRSPDTKPGMEANESNHDNGSNAPSSDEKDEETAEPSLPSHVQFRREAFRRSKVTTLGRFYAAMPFGFTYSRLVAYGILFGGRCLNPCVVMACALGMLDIFVLPSPFVIKETSEFAKVVVTTTEGRLHADRGRCSDPIAVLEVFNAYLCFRHSTTSSNGHKWAEARGVHLKRLKQLTNTVGEIALRLSVLVGRQEQCLQLQQLHAFCKSARRQPAASTDGKMTEKDEATAAPVKEVAASEGRQKRTALDTAAASALALSKGTANASLNDAETLSFRNLGDDDDGGDVRLDDLHHVGLVGASRSSSSHRRTSELLGDTQAPVDPHLLELDQLTVLQLQFLLGASMRTNLLQANSKPTPLSTVAQTKVAPPKPVTPAAAAATSAPAAQGVVQLLEHVDPVMCVQIKHVPLALMKEGLCREFREFDTIAPAVRDTFLDESNQRVVLEFREPAEGPSLRLGLDMFNPKATSSDWASVLALPVHVKQMALARMCHRGSLKITPPVSGSRGGLARDGSTSSSSSSTASSSVATKPIPLECKLCSLPGDVLKFERVYDSVPTEPDDTSILHSLRVYKVARSDITKRALYSDCNTPIEAASSSVDVCANGARNSQHPAVIPVFAVAASVKLSGRRTLRAERLTMMPCGVYQRVGAFFLAVLFGGPFVFSPDRQQIIGVQNKSTLVSVPLDGGDEADVVNEEELAWLAGVCSFQQRIIPIVPSLPAAMAAAIQALHDSAQLTHTFLSHRVPCTMILPGPGSSSGASSADSRKLSVQAAFIELIKPLIPTELLRGGAQSLSARPTPLQLDPTTVRSRPGMVNTSSVASSALSSSTTKQPSFSITSASSKPNSVMSTSVSLPKTVPSASMEQLQKAMTTLHLSQPVSVVAPHSATATKAATPGMTYSHIASRSSSNAPSAVPSAPVIAGMSLSASALSSVGFLQSILAAHPAGITRHQLLQEAVTRHGTDFLQTIGMPFKSFIESNVLSGFFTMHRCVLTDDTLIICGPQPLQTAARNASMKVGPDAHASASAGTNSFASVSATADITASASTSNAQRLSLPATVSRQSHAEVAVDAKEPLVTGTLATQPAKAAPTMVPSGSLSTSVSSGSKSINGNDQDPTLQALRTVILQAGSEGMRMSFIGTMFVAMHSKSWPEFVRPLEVRLKDFILAHAPKHFTVLDGQHPQGAVVKCVNTSPASSMIAAPAVSKVVPAPPASRHAAPPSSSSSSSTAAGSSQVDSADAKLIKLVRELLPSDGSSLLCSELAADFLSRTHEQFATRAGRKIGLWLRAHPADFRVHGKEPWVSTIQRPSTLSTSAVIVSTLVRHPPTPNKALLSTDEDLVRLVGRLLPADGSSILCSILGHAFLARTGAPFADRAGKLVPWLEKHTDDFNVRKAGTDPLISLHRR